MKFIETKREGLRRERIALNEHHWGEFRELLEGIGERIMNAGLGLLTTNSVMRHNGDYWIRDSSSDPTLAFWELKAKYFEAEQREPKIGDWGYFWDYASEEYAIFGQLKEIDNGKFHTVDEIMNYFSHTIPPHIQEAMKEPEYEVVYSFGESSGEIVVGKEIAPGIYAGTRGGVNVVLKRVER